ncbi:MAG: hypothetical protein FK731_11695, partial [Asgard group archaeon]|nr:hypothetical protein [Asgard group archaeon]
MANVLITNDDGSVRLDGTINANDIEELVALIEDQYMPETMSKTWSDVSPEELGLETEEAIEQIREEEG